MRRIALTSSGSMGVHRTGLSFGQAATAALFAPGRLITTNGRVTNEDRRWWLLHLECAPDVHPGTFVAWLDCCGTHTTKKLIERNIWTIEQVAALDSEQVDEMKFQEGCIKMDVVWEHARTILTALKNRATSGGVEMDLQSKVLELRKKRELEKKRTEIVSERAETMEARESTLQKLREAVAAKKAELLKKQQNQQQASNSPRGDEDTTQMPTSAGEAIDEIANKRSQ